MKIDKNRDGGENKILLKQDYSIEDDRKYIIHLISFFKDDRYIKVNGKPVFIIYRPKFFPDIWKNNFNLERGSKLVLKIYI